MLEFSKIVGIYPSTPASYEDPFFTETPVAIEESVRPIASQIISTQKDLMPELPAGVSSADVNQIILKHVQEALFNNVPAQEALDAAVEEANGLIN
jgi:ABC-type glycerol-3-phosphate transport system substrate-binding protein